MILFEKSIIFSTTGLVGTPITRLGLVLADLTCFSLQGLLLDAFDCSNNFLSLFRLPFDLFTGWRILCDRSCFRKNSSKFPWRISLFREFRLGEDSFMYMQSGFRGSCCSVGSSTIFKIGSLSERLMSKQDSDFRLDLPRDRFVNSGFGIGNVSFLSSLLTPVGFALFFLLLVNFFTLTTSLLLTCLFFSSINLSSLSTIS